MNKSGTILKACQVAQPLNLRSFPGRPFLVPFIISSTTLLRYFRIRLLLLSQVDRCQLIRLCYCYHDHESLNRKYLTTKVQRGNHECSRCRGRACKVYERVRRYHACNEVHCFQRPFLQALHGQSMMRRERSLYIGDRKASRMP
jgi:hypothetical protein